jgi:hypothetical protein
MFSQTSKSQAELAEGRVCGSFNKKLRRRKAVTKKKIIMRRIDNNIMSSGETITNNYRSTQVYFNN